MPVAMSEPFGTYKLHKKLAQGGMAEVFLASRTSELGGFEKHLAIKRIFSHLVTQQEIVNMFIDEARIAARLHHPNIVQIYDLGMVDESFFIAMEYIDGLDLRRLCELGVKRRNFIPRELAVYIIAQIAAGLHYAHTRKDEYGRPMKIVHRDVSPQNVLISRAGAVKLCDFGIAKAESRLTNTRTGEFKGKFSYMSPEQFGQGALDKRSDIFTLGILLYEVTVATRLFKARSEYETMRRITEGEVRRPTEVRPEYPSGLEEIVLKTLAVKASERYQSAQALQEDLEEWLFESRARVGPRQLAAYLETLFSEDEPGEEVLWPQPMSKEKEDQQSLVDATVELTVSDAEVLEFAELEEEETVIDLHPRFGEDDEAPTTIVIVPAQSVEVRQVSSEEARARRGSGEVEDDLDSTLVDRRIEDQTTFPVHSTPKVEVDEEELIELTEVVDDGEELEELIAAFSGQKPLSGQGSGESGVSRSSLGQISEPEIGRREPSEESVEFSVFGPSGQQTMRATPPAGRALSTKINFLSGRALVLGGGVAAVLLVGLLSVLLSAGSNGADNGELEALGEIEFVGDEEVFLRLNTEPPGASVVANGLLVPGKTPLDVPLVEGKENDLWIVDARFRPERLFIMPGEGSLEETVSLERIKNTEFAALELRSSPPGAQVLLNGEKIGRAPLRLEGVRADFGAHVQFELSGHLPTVAWIDLKAQGEHRIEASLAPIESQIVEGHFELSPAQFITRLDSGALLESPQQQEFLAGQWLDLNLEAKGFRSRRQTLRLDRIGSFYLWIALEQEIQPTGQISLEVRPKSAIYIDSKSFGSGPLAELDLPAGETTVVVETVAGSRLRVPLEVQADEHRRYLVLVDGEEIQVQEQGRDKK